MEHQNRYTYTQHRWYDPLKTGRLSCRRCDMPIKRGHGADMTCKVPKDSKDAKEATHGTA